MEVAHLLLVVLFVLQLALMVDGSLDVHLLQIKPPLHVLFVLFLLFHLSPVPGGMSHLLVLISLVLHGLSHVSHLIVEQTPEVHLFFSPFEGVLGHIELM